MTESRDARPGAVPARPAGVTRPQLPSSPTAPTKVQSPRAPAVAPAASPAPRSPQVAPSPRAPAVTQAQNANMPNAIGGRWEDEPPSGGWDSADTVNSFPEPDALPGPRRGPPELPPAVAAARVLPAVSAAAAPPPATQASPATAAPATPVSPGTMRGPYQTSPGVGVVPPVLPAAGAPATSDARAARGGNASGIGGAGAQLGTAMREEVWAIVRAAVEEAMGPLVARQRELEARVERAERERDAERASRGRAAQAGPSTAMQGGSGSSAASRLASIPIALGSVAPPAAVRAPAPAVPSFDQAPGSVTNPGGYQGAGGSTEARAQPLGLRGSIPPTGYGVSVIVAPRPSLDLDAVGPVDIDGFDGGAAKRRVVVVVVVLMLLLVAGAILMTVLSYN